MAATLPVWKANGTAVSGTAGFNVAWPAGHATGDFAILLVNSSNNSIATPANWTSFGTYTGTGVAGAADSCGLQMFYRFATSGAEAVAVIPDSGDHTLAVITTFTGVSTVNPVEAISAYTVKSALSTADTFPTVTTLGANRLVVAAISTGQESVKSAATFAGLGTFTARGVGTTLSGLDGGIACFSGSKAVAGATGTGSVTESITSKAISVTFALTPVDFEKTVTITAGITTGEDVPTGAFVLRYGQIFATGLASAEAFGTAVVVNVVNQRQVYRLIAWRGDGDNSDRTVSDGLSMANTDDVLTFNYSTKPSDTLTAPAGQQRAYADPFITFQSGASRFQFRADEPWSAEFNRYLATGFLSNIHDLGVDYGSFAMRQEPLDKYVDLANWTGTGVFTPRTIAHSLGTVPKVVLMKASSTPKVMVHFVGFTTYVFDFNSGKPWNFADFFTADPDATNFFVSGTENFSATLHYTALLGAGPSANKVNTANWTGNSGSQSVNLGFRPGFIYVTNYNIAAGTGTSGQPPLIFDYLHRHSFDEDVLVGMSLDSNASKGASQQLRIRLTATGFDIEGVSDVSLNATGNVYYCFAMPLASREIIQSGSSIASGEAFGTATITGGTSGLALVTDGWFAGDTEDLWNNELYRLAFEGKGGTGPWTFATTSGALPTGLAMSSAGVIDGRTSANGAFSFGITCTPTVGAAFTRNFTVNVATMPVVYEIIRYTGDGTASRTFPMSVDLTGGGLVTLRKSDNGAAGILYSQNGTNVYSLLSATAPVATSTFGNGTMTLVFAELLSGVDCNLVGQTYDIAIARNYAKAFQVVRYTGDGSASLAVPHGLGVVPDVIYVRGIATAFASGQNENMERFYWLRSVNSLTRAIDKFSNPINSTDLMAAYPDATNVYFGSSAAGNSNTQPYMAIMYGNDPSARGMGFVGSTRAVRGDRYIPLATSGPATPYYNGAGNGFPAYAETPAMPYGRFNRRLQAFFGADVPQKTAGNLPVSGGNGLVARVITAAAYNSTSVAGPMGMSASHRHVHKTDALDPEDLMLNIDMFSGAWVHTPGYFMPRASFDNGQPHYGRNYTLMGLRGPSTQTTGQGLAPSSIAPSETFGSAVVGVAGGAQSVTGAGAIASAQAIGNATVTVAAANLAPSSITSLEAFGTAKLTSFVQPAGIVSGEAFGTPLMGSYIAATGIASGEAFGAATVALASGPQTVTVTAGITSAEAFGSPTLTPGAVSIVPSGIASLQAFGAATVSPGAVNVAPGSIASAEAFGTARMTSSVAPAGIVSGEALGAATLTTSNTIAAVGIASAQAFGTALLTQNVTAVGIASAEAFGTPSLALALSPSSIASAEAFGAASLTSVASIEPAGIAGAEAVPGPSLATGGVDIAPPSIGSDEAFGAASISVGASDIAAIGIATGEAFGVATLDTGATNIDAQGVASAEAFGLPAFVVGGVTIGAMGIASLEFVNDQFLISDGQVSNQTVPLTGIPSAEAFGTLLWLKSRSHGHNAVGAIRQDTGAYTANREIIAALSGTRAGEDEINAAREGKNQISAAREGEDQQSAAREGEPSITAERP